MASFTVLLPIMGRRNAQQELKFLGKTSSKYLRDRALSSAPSSFPDPGKFVAGCTRRDLETNPVIAAYFAANFAAFKDIIPEDEIDTSRNTLHTLEDLKEDGYEEEERPPYISRNERLYIANNSKSPVEAATIVADASKNRALYCHLRDPELEEGSRKCRSMRDNFRFIPGVLYGSDPTRNISSSQLESRVFVKTEWKEIQRELSHHGRDHFSSRVYDLTIHSQDTVQKVLPKNVQFHPVQNKVYCVNYLRYHPGRPIDIPIRYTNEEESPIMKRGGFIAPVDRTIKCIVEEGANIPDFIDLDCTGLKAKEVVRINRLIIPEGVIVSKNVNRKQFLVGTVFGRRADDDDDEDEGSKVKESDDDKDAETK